MAFLIIETFAIVQIVRGFFGNISADAYTKIEKIEATIAFRKKQLQAAIENNPDKIEMFERTINSLQKSVDSGLIDVETALNYTTAQDELAKMLGLKEGKRK